jgi:hypothetical protein
MIGVRNGGRVMAEISVVRCDESIALCCDECGQHINHWSSGIELDEMIAFADDHECETE